MSKKVLYSSEIYKNLTLESSEFFSLLDALPYFYLES